MTVPQSNPTDVAPPIRGSRTRRCFEVGVTVVLWIALSIVFHLDRGHLLLGIPLTAAFQLWIRRQPLRTLWVRDGGKFSLDAAGWLFAIVFAIYPGYRLFGIIQAGEPAVKVAIGVAALAGAIPAAYALRNFRRPMIRPLLLCLATAGTIAVLIVVGFALGGGLEQYTLWHRAQLFLTGMLRYVTVGFVVEEVSFRGAFDAHVYQPGESRGVWSALFVSALWGLWHIPGLIGKAPLLAAVPALVIVHCAVGVPLSIFWRRSGNLLVPGTAHALGDAVRNALLGAPL